jgi:hypothetical protein
LRRLTKKKRPIKLPKRRTPPTTPPAIPPFAAVERPWLSVEVEVEVGIGTTLLGVALWDTLDVEKVEETAVGRVETDDDGGDAED